MVMVKEKVIIIFNSVFVYCLDVLSNVMVENEKVWGNLPKNCKIIAAVYDEADNVYLILDGELDNRKVNVYDIVPNCIWKDEIVTGFLRGSEHEYNINIPLSLFDIIKSFCDL